MAAADIEAKMGLDDSEYRAKLQQAPGAAKSAFSSAAVAIGSVTAAMAMKAAAFVGGQLKSTLTFWQTQEDAADSLNDALRLSGAGEGWSDKLQKAASDLQAYTSYGDEATLSTMALGLNMDIAASQIEDVTKAAMGLAKSYNMDMNTAMMLFAKANKGITNALSRYGIVVDHTKSKEEQFNEILRQSRALFENAEADTLSEKIAQVGNAFGDVKERIGEIVAKAFRLGEGAEKLTKWLSDIAQYMQDHMPQIIHFIQDIWLEVKQMAKIIFAIVKPLLAWLWGMVEASFLNIWNMLKWVFNNGMKVLKNLPTVVPAVLKDVWNYIKGFAKASGEVLVGIGKAMWSAIKGEGFNGFGEAFDKLEQDMNALREHMFDETNKAMKEIGTDALPKEIPRPRLDDALMAYKDLGKEITRINEETEKERQQNQLDFEKRLAEQKRKKTDMQDSTRGKKEKQDAAEQNRKVDIVGTFSTRFLNNMLGQNSPMARVARETKKNGDYLKQIEKNTREDEGEVWA